MTSDIRVVELGRIMNFQRGYDLTHSQMTGGTVPVVGSSEVIGYHNVAKAEAPVLLIGRSGTVGRPQFYNQSIWPHNTTLFVTDFLGNVPEYCFYLLKSLNLEDYANSSSVPTLNRNFIHPLKVALSDIKTQSAIAHVLRTIDDKIALNNKINAELEQTARLIYDYWFTQFDFPDAQGKPYKSSGGAMCYNEQLKRKIPFDWKVNRLCEICKTTLGGTPSRNNPYYWDNGNIAWLNSGEISDFPIISSSEKITELGLKESAAKLMPKGSIMISITGNIRVSVLAISASANQSVVGVYETFKIKNSYLYRYLSAYIPVFEALMTGAVQKHINKDVIDETLLLIPNNEILQKFQSIVQPMFESIINNHRESAQLAQLRDWLLPMLLNGQVKVAS